MKARIKGTKELKDIIAGEVYLEDMNRMPLGINEVEILPDNWNELRNQAAIAAMQGIMNFFGSIDYNRDTIAELAVQQADALIAELKKGE